MFYSVLFLCVSAVVVVQSTYFENSAAYWIERTNVQGSKWKAGIHPQFLGWSINDLKKLMGTRLDDPTPMPEKTFNPDEFDNLPTQFTAGVDKWDYCNDTIQHIRDQAACGSCWAVAAAETASDRTCIANQDQLSDGSTVSLSAEQLMSCCWYCGQGCHGGYPRMAMTYWHSAGLVTGGDYGSECGCLPYEVKPCGPQGCHDQPVVPTPKCEHTCRSGYDTDFTEDKHYADRTYSTIFQNNMMKEIYSNGPIECAFSVYENFMHYKSGVYDHHEGSMLGGHAVKVIGWGEENGTPYWLINNSWNTTWGDNGQFKFVRGKNLCGMEMQCVTGVAKATEKSVDLVC